MTGAHLTGFCISFAEVCVCVGLRLRRYCAVPVQLLLLQLDMIAPLTPRCLCCAVFSAPVV